MSRYDEATRQAKLAALFAKRPQVIKPGLERIRAAAEALRAEDPLAFGPPTPFVIVAGTNGKGSTSGFLWQLLAATGRKVGLYTSPHLVDFAERMQITSERVTIDDVLVELDDLETRIPAKIYEPMSFFELTTLAAMRLFARHKTTLNVYEVGLGGRWDATNVIDPDYGELVCSVITSIGIDHVEFLGDTVEKIAAEKAGVMRRGKPVFWGGTASSAAEADAVIRAEADRIGAPLRTFGSIDAEPPSVWPKRLERAPSYLQRNFALALAAYRMITGSARIPERFDDPSLPMPPSLAGRFQRAQVEGSEVLFDVCHNVDGARVFVRGLEESGYARRGKLPALVSILADKKCDDVLDVLRTALGPILLFPLNTERTWSKASLAPRHHDLPWAASFSEAFAQQRAFAAAEHPLVICGSVSGVGEVLRHFGLEPLAR